MGDAAGAVQKVLLRAAPRDARTVSLGDEVAVHYTGRLQSNGYIFDSSRGRGRELVLLLGAGGVIKGWELGLQQMQIGEVAKLICPPAVAYGKKGIAGKVPPNETLEFEIEVLTACKPIVKDTLVESESNVCPKEEDYVRVHMIVKGLDGAVRDDYFAQRQLEFYMKDHVARSEHDGKWKAGNLLKKLVEQMSLHERAAFAVHEGIVDKYGNAPFWARDNQPVSIEIELKVIGKDEDICGDGGVIKHKISEGEGYEKPTDGAHLSFVYRILSGSRSGGRIRETDSEGEVEARSRAAVQQTTARAGLGAAYDKWSKLKISEDGDIEESVPEAVEKALADSEAQQRKNHSDVLYESWDPSQPCKIHCGFGETAEGLEDALMTMKKNEHAMISITQGYGFGAHDLPSPCVDLPSDRTLHFEVVLLGIGKGLEHWNLGEEGKRTHAGRKRERGNQFFKRGNYRRALKLYQPVVDKMGYFMKMPKRPSEQARAQAAAAAAMGASQAQVHNAMLEPDNSGETAEEKALKKELQVPCFLNIASCRSKMGDDRGAIDACNAALLLDDANIKGLYRRAMARISLCDYDKARADLQTLLGNEAAKADAVRELSRIHKLEEAAKKKQRKAFGGLFRSSVSTESVAGEAEGAEGAGEEQAPRCGVEATGEVTYEAAEGEEAALDGDGKPRARVKKVTRYTLPVPDVAPTVRIAGIYGAGEGSGDEDGD